MEKIKQFLKNKRNRAIGIASLALVLAGVVAVCLLPLGQSTGTLAAISSQPESSSTPVSSKTVSVPAISVPDIPAPLSSKPTVSSSPASAPALDLTVETSSKAEPPASKPAPVEPTKPVQKPATDTSTSVPESVPEPAPSKPESLLPDPLPVEPEESPDGWKHGDTQVFDGETYYYHAGAKAFIDQIDWNTWGPYPQAKEIQDHNGYWYFDGSFLKEGAEAIDVDGETAHWCVQEQAWVTNFSWTNGWHDKIHPGWNK